MVSSIFCLFHFLFKKPLAMGLYDMWYRVKCHFFKPILKDLISRLEMKQIAWGKYETKRQKWIQLNEVKKSFFGYERFTSFRAIFELWCLRYIAVENIVRQGEISWIRRNSKHLQTTNEMLLKLWFMLPAFSPFPTMFSKAFFLRVSESRDCVVKNKWVYLFTKRQKFFPREHSKNLHATILILLQ